jgi:hypothetical protein
MNLDEKIIELEKLYSNLTKEGSLGGVYPLLEISDLCKSICSDSNPKKILPSFILYTTFKTLAGWQDERETPLSESERLYSKLNSSIITHGCSVKQSMYPSTSFYFCWDHFPDL